jgi:hypothetical protein
MSSRLKLGLPSKKIIFTFSIIIIIGKIAAAKPGHSFSFLNLLFRFRNRLLKD